MHYLDKEDIFGYNITTCPVSVCVAQIMQWLSRNDSARYLVCANPHSFEVARRDNLFDASLKNADILIPDGTGIVIASKVLGGTIKQRVTGSDIFGELNKALNSDNRYRCFFLGSTTENLQKIVERMKREFPGVEVAGVYSPPFKKELDEWDNEKIIKIVNRSHADILWVGMSAPKQEKWIYKNRDKLDVRFIGAIGAVFDFFTERIRRSRPFFQRLGLEWLPRLLQEPRRLWRRNLISTPLFIMRIISAKLGTEKQTSSDR